MGEGIIDLDVMRPEKQIIKVAGKSIDTSMISFGIMIDMIDKIEDMSDVKAGSKKTAKRYLSTFKDVIDEILKEADKDIDDKWIKENINGFMYMILIDKIVTPLLDNVTNMQTSTKSITKKKEI